MDFSILSEYFELVVIVACLVVGYVIKHATIFKWIGNDNIPFILAVFGAGLNLVVSGLTVEAAVWGSLMGLCSTGLHQAFKKFVEKSE